MGRPQDVIFQRPKDVCRGRPRDIGRELLLTLHRGPYGTSIECLFGTSSGRSKPRFEHGRSLRSVYGIFSLRMRSGRYYFS